MVENDDYYFYLDEINSLISNYSNPIKKIYVILEENISKRVIYYLYILSNEKMLQDIIEENLEVYDDKLHEEILDLAKLRVKHEINLHNLGDFSIFSLIFEKIINDEEFDFLDMVFDFVHLTDTKIVISEEIYEYLQEITDIELSQFFDNKYQYLRIRNPQSSAKKRKMKKKIFQQHPKYSISELYKDDNKVFFVVSGDSMYPLFVDGMIIALNCKFNHPIELDTIIGFDASGWYDGRNFPVIHRVKSYEYNGEKIIGYYTYPIKNSGDIDPPGFEKKCILRKYVIGIWDGFLDYNEKESWGEN